MDNPMSSIANPATNQPFPSTGGLGTGGQPISPVANTNGDQQLPVKRRPGRPKGSTKKHLLGEPTPPKNKRPVGRPRKDGLPAGSVGPSRAKRERNRSAPQYAPQFAGVPYPVGQYPPSISAPYIPQPAFQIDPSLGGGGSDEWADLARSNPNAFLGVLLAALAAPNPVSNTGPSVEEAFKDHLVSLAPTGQPQLNPIPSLYSILKTFWLPSSPAYFSLTASASTTRTPSEHRFLYWDPLPLVFNGVACPSCSAPLVNNGRITSGPVKVYDIEKPFFIIGCEYVCKSLQCINATSPEGRKYASTDGSILRSLPARLKDELPASLLFGDNDTGSGPNIWNWKALGVSTTLWNMVQGCLSANLKKEVILHLIFSVQGGVAMRGEGGEGGEGEQKEEEEEDDDGEDDLIEDPQQQQQQQAGPSGASSQQQEGPSESGGGNSTFPAGGYGSDTTWKLDSSAAMNVLVKTSTPVVAVQQQPQQQQVVPAPPMQAYSQYGYAIPAQYPFMVQQVMNGQHILSLGTPTHAVPSAIATDAITIDPGAAETQQKRSPRHCCKCGSQECKGKGGRSFCMNPCQDCGKLDCKGRNSRRPDKRCTEGWA